MPPTWQMIEREIWQVAGYVQSLGRKTPVSLPGEPERRLLYVPVREMGAYYFKGEAKYVPGTEFMGGGEQALLGDEAYGAIRALDVRTRGFSELPVGLDSAMCPLITCHGGLPEGLN
jgi:hypothetical protein